METLKQNDLPEIQDQNSALLAPRSMLFPDSPVQSLQPVLVYDTAKSALMIRSQTHPLRIQMQLCTFLSSVPLAPIFIYSQEILIRWETSVAAPTVTETTTHKIQARFWANVHSFETGSSAKKKEISTIRWKSTKTWQHIPQWNKHGTFFFLLIHLVYRQLSYNWCKFKFALQSQKITTTISQQNTTDAQVWYPYNTIKLIWLKLGSFFTLEVVPSP